MAERYVSNSSSSLRTRIRKGDRQSPCLDLWKSSYSVLASSFAPWHQRRLRRILHNTICAINCESNMFSCFSPRLYLLNEQLYSLRFFRVFISKLFQSSKYGARRNNCSIMGLYVTFNTQTVVYCSNERATLVDILHHRIYWLVRKRKGNATQELPSDQHATKCSAKTRYRLSHTSPNGPKCS